MRVVAIPHPRKSTSSHTERRALNSWRANLSTAPHQGCAYLSSREQLGVVMQPWQQRREAVQRSNQLPPSSRHSARCCDCNDSQTGPCMHCQHISGTYMDYAPALCRRYQAPSKASGHQEHSPSVGILGPCQPLSRLFTHVLSSASPRQAPSRKHGRPAEQCVADAAC